MRVLVAMGLWAVLALASSCGSRTYVVRSEGGLYMVTVNSAGEEISRRRLP